MWWDRSALPSWSRLHVTIFTINSIPYAIHPIAAFELLFSYHDNVIHHPSAPTSFLFQVWHCIHVVPPSSLRAWSRLHLTIIIIDSVRYAIHSLAALETSIHCYENIIAVPGSKRPFLLSLRPFWEATETLVPMELSLVFGWLNVQSSFRLEYLTALGNIPSPGGMWSTSLPFVHCQ